MKLLFRPAVHRDRDFCRRLKNDAMRPLASAFITWHEAAQTSKFNQTWNPEQVQIFQVEAPQGRLDVGWMQLLYSPEEITLRQIFIAPEHRGAGLGSQALRGVLNMAAASSRSVVLEVLINNPARTLYRRLGFEDIGVHGFKATMRCSP